MYGFSDVFINQNVNILKMFPYVFKQRVVYGFFKNGIRL